MMTPFEPLHESSENSYGIHSARVLEIARLAVHDKLIIKAIGEPLLEQSQAARSTFHDILDLACGYGHWVLEVARLLPHAQVTGIDSSEEVIEVARTNAQTQGLTNAHFAAMNILKPLTFPEEAFDLINVRNLVALMTPITWPILIHQTVRICRPGGVMRVTESEMPITNSPAFEQLAHWAIQAFQKTGRAFSSDARNFAITTQLGSLLTEAGYQNIKYKPYAIDFSWGTEAHASFYEDFKVVFQLGKDFITGLGLASAEQYDETYAHFLSEMQSEDFSAITYMLTVWGIKP